jgi:hypothetical protein
MLPFLRRLAPLFVLLTTAACDEPATPCTISTKPYFGKYRVVSQTGPCGPLIGDDVGLEVYPAAGPSGPTIALQSMTMKNMWFEAKFNGASNLEEQRPYALGAFPEFADADGMCRAGDLAPAEMDLPPVQVVDDFGNVFVVGGGQVRETWRNLTMYVTPDMPGVRFAAELEAENLTRGCKVTYTVSALSPSVYCGEFGDFSDVPNDAYCSPEPVQTQWGGSLGSGIDPRIETKCDQVTLRCVLVGSPLDPL